MQDRGLEGTVTLGPNEASARVFAGILSIEFLLHAWDYAIATGQTVNASDAVAEYVLGLARQIITPRGRGNIGFDKPVPVSDDVSVLDRLIAFTGRQAVS